MRALQRNVYLVLECFHRLPTGPQAYYEIRSLDPWSLAEAELAARFLYLNRYCFNGLYRTNRQGQFNVPYAPPKGNTTFDDDLVIEAARALTNASVQQGDFESTLHQTQEGDFVYLDPPYAVQSRRVFAEYLPGSFSQHDLGRLGYALLDLDRRAVDFLVSYADSTEARKLLAPWRPRRVWTRRNIAGFASRRRGHYELLATNIAEVRGHAG